MIFMYSVRVETAMVLYQLHQLYATTWLRQYCHDVFRNLIAGTTRVRRSYINYKVSNQSHPFLT